MRKGKMLFWVILLTMGTMILVSCSLRWLANPSWEPPKVVTVEGDDVWWNWLHQVGVFYEPVKKGQSTHLLLRDGDILFPLRSGSAPFLYRDNDGLSLSIRCEKYRTELKGKTIALLTEKGEGWEWLEKAMPEDLSALRLIGIGKEIDAKRIAALKRLSQVNPHIGLVMESKAMLHQVLPLFDPAVLLLFLPEGQMDAQEVLTVLSEKNHVRTLCIDGRILEMDTAFLSRMPNLDTLRIDKWDPSISGPLPGNLNNLRRLTLADSEVRNLALLGNQPHLDELRLEGKCPVESCDGMSNFPELKELALWPCEKIKDLSPLKQLKQLKWLGLPLTTTQGQLESIVHDHPNLVGLELFKTDKVTDLSVLKQLKSLKYLHVCAPNAKFDSLFTMKGLRWLAITIKDKDEELLVKIQQALPETSVVRASPVCLGSGWILLLAPGVLFACWVEKRRRRAAQRGCRL